MIKLHRYKHSYGKGAEIEIWRQHKENICPLKLLNSYLVHRGTSSGPLFVTSRGRPLSKQLHASWLRRCCSAAGFQPNQFSSHCLRVGAATMAAQMGKTATEIMSLGRWSSSAYLKYIVSVEPLMAPPNLSPRCGAATSSAQRQPGPAQPGARKTPYLRR